MKRFAILFAVTAMALSSTGQSYGRYNRPYAYMGVTIGGGLNTMLYSMDSGSQTPGFGMDLGVHYTHFFSAIGVGVGLHYTAANAYAVYNFDEVTNGLTHADNPGAHYNLTTHYDNWKERQNMTVLGLPIEVFYRTHIGGGRHFICGLGVEFDLPMRGGYSGVDGSYTTSGVFPAIGTYPVSDMPEHGFGTFYEVPDTPIEDLKAGVSVLADIGLRMPLGSGGGWYIGIYGSYGLTSLLDDGEGGSLLTIDPHNSQRIVYGGTFSYGAGGGGALNLLRVGVKVGVDLGSAVDN